MTQEPQRVNIPVGDIPEANRIILDKHGRRTDHLCWKFRFFIDDPVGLWVYYIDAHTSEYVDSRDEALYYTTSGDITGS